MNKKRVTISLTEQAIKNLEKLAKLTARSKSNLIEVLLAEEVKHHE